MTVEQNNLGIVKHLNTTKKLGRPLLEGAKRHVAACRVDDDTKAAIQAASESTGQSGSDWIHEAIKEKLAKLK